MQGIQIKTDAQQAATKAEACIMRHISEEKLY